jgi:hypothetical protein
MASPRRRTRHERPDILDGAILHYAPENELGVVFLFAELASRWRLRVEKIQAGFPDCVAYQKTQRGERRIRIEFEYRSRSFATHGHSPEGCDWIVCWEHDWLDAPRSIHVVELRREFGLDFNVWVSPVNDPYKEELEATPRGLWSVPSQANEGDLQVFYLTSPEKRIEYVYRLEQRATHRTAGWKPGRDYMARIRRVCKLRAPVFLEDLRSHRILSTAGFVRGKMRTRHNATEYWPFLFDMIVRRNPGLRSQLTTYAPQRL